LTVLSNRSVKIKPAYCCRFLFSSFDRKFLKKAPPPFGTFDRLAQLVFQTNIIITKTMADEEGGGGFNMDNLQTMGIVNAMRTGDARVDMYVLLL
jgi:hypothetical protein